MKRDAPEVSGRFILQQINSQKLQKFEEREKELRNQIHYVKYNLMRKYQNMSAASKTGGWRRGWGICWCYLSATKPGMEAERHWVLLLLVPKTFPPNSERGQAELRAFHGARNQEIQQAHRRPL